MLHNSSYVLTCYTSLMLMNIDKKKKYLFNSTCYNIIFRINSSVSLIFLCHKSDQFLCHFQIVIGTIEFTTLYRQNDSPLFCDKILIEIVNTIVIRHRHIIHICSAPWIRTRFNVNASAPNCTRISMTRRNVRFHSSVYRFFVL